MSKLEIKELSKSFKENKIINSVSLSVAPGDFMVLVGPSGSGKSTILRTIAGLENPDSGLIEINDKVVNNLPPKDRDIAMVFQNYALYPHMSVYENLAFPLKMKKQDKNIIDKAVHEIAEMLGIRKYLMRKPKELSGGERQRVALGRAIIRKPQLFLMDEPLSNLDAKLRTQMRAEILKLHKSLSSTIIYVTHDQVEALTMGNKIAVLNMGSIQQIGTPKQVYENPANVFVAGFVGSPPMNFFDFQVTSASSFCLQGKNIQLKTDNSRLNYLIDKKYLSKPLKLGIRPEHINLGESSDFALNVIVDLVEMLGHEYIIYVNAIDLNPNILFSLKVINQSNLKPNDKINITFDLKNAKFFNPLTGENLELI